MNTMYTSYQQHTDTLNLSAPEPVLPLSQRGLQSLIDAYLNHCQDVGIGASARKNYRYSLQRFATWWGIVGSSCNCELSATMLRKFGGWLSEQLGEKTKRPFTYTYRKQTHYHIKQMFNWACLNGITRINWARLMPIAKGSVRKRTAPTFDTLLKLFRALEDGSAPTRNMAILAVFCGTGIRLQECADLMVDDVTFNPGALTGRINIRNGKGNKQRRVVFDEATGIYLKRYIEICNRRSGFYLWYSGRNSCPRLTARGIDHMIRTAKERAGLTDEIQAAHDFRRFFATHWNRLRPGMGHTKFLQEQLGHANMRETMDTYTLPSVDDVERHHVSPMTTIHNITDYKFEEKVNHDIDLTI